MQRTKCAVYTRPANRTPAWHAARGDILEDIAAHAGVAHHGLDVYGVPVGDDDYVAATLAVKGAQLRADFGALQAKLDPVARDMPELPLRQ
mmetsp:Transcript_28714/g.84676  ORF Transcript_28714/g.84676 Transcript_28714/m.84676 type:complete len:91 (+) Transcript_28714:1751-2023(+)